MKKSDKFITIGRMKRSLCDKFQSAFSIFDLFSTTQFLRYNDQPQYKTSSGGICSLIIIISFIIILMQSILSTINYEYIYSQTSLLQQVQPSSYATTQSPFLFALGISGLNLNDPDIKYFNIQVSQKVQNGNGKYGTQIPLIPCQRKVWVDFNQTLGTSFDKLKLDQWLCLANDAKLQFQGKFSSNIFKYVKISVQTCTVSATQNRTCVESSYVDSMISANGAITFNYYFLNTIINANDINYKRTYLQDRNYFQFTKNLGTTANIFISSYKVITDSSLWPLTINQIDEGGIVYEETQSFIYQSSTTTYMQLYLRKSSLSLQINRSFKKYDDSLSYVGGLFSFIITVLFIMFKYNKYAYQIEVASKIYNHGNKYKIKQKLVNLLSFFAITLYSILQYFGKTPSWKLMRQFSDAKTEMGKQLDIKLIIKKLSFLEDCMSYLFEDFQLKCLHFKGKLTLFEAAQIRKRFSLRSKLLKLKKIVKYENNSNIDSQNGSPSHLQGKQFQMIRVKNISQLSSDLQNSLQKQSFQKSDQIIQKNSKNKSVISQKEQDEDSISELSSSQESESEKKGAYDKLIECIEKLQANALSGNDRSHQIYMSLDQDIRHLTGTGKRYERMMAQSRQQNGRSNVRLMTRTISNLHQMQFKDLSKQK